MVIIAIIYINFSFNALAYTEILNINFNAYPANAKSYGKLSLWNSNINATAKNKIAGKSDTALSGVITADNGYLQPLYSSAWKLSDTDKTVFAVSSYLSNIGGSIENSIWKDNGDGYFYFKMNQDGTMKAGRNSELDLGSWVAEQWYRCVFVLDYPSRTYDVYLNGKFKGGGIFNGDTVSRFQSKAFPGGTVADANIAAVDDMICYYGSYDPSEDLTSITSQDSYVYIDSVNKKIVTNPYITVGQMKSKINTSGTLRIYYNDSYDEIAPDDAPMSSKYKIVVISPNGKSYDYYTWEMADEPPEDISISFYNTTKAKTIDSMAEISDGDIITAEVSQSDLIPSSAHIIIAYYQDNKLLGISTDSNALDGDLSASITIPDSTKGTIKSMIFNNLTDITPIANKKILGTKSSDSTTTNVLYNLKQFTNGAHPRVYANKKHFDTIYATANSNTITRNWYNSLIKSANDLLGENSAARATPYAYSKSDGTRLDGTGATLSRSITLGFAYYTTKEDKYAQLLWELIEPVCSYPDWNQNSHFLCTATLASSFAIAYDWCYDFWTENQKWQMRRALNNFVHKPAMNLYRTKSGWTQSDTNWNAVCNMGVALSALAIIDDEYTEYCAEIISHSISSIKKMLPNFAPDGGWFEGVDYWHYMIEFLVPYVSSLESALGDDFGIFDLEGMNQTGYYSIYSTGNTQYIFNYHDATIYAHGMTEFMWLGNKYNDDNLIKYRFKQITQQGYAPQVKDFLWLQPSKINLGTNLSLPFDRMFRETEIATFRTSFDKTAAYAAVHGGENTIAHGQLDIGQFIYEYNGERWAEDLGKDDYNLAHYWIMNESLQTRWAYYRNRAEGHNTLVINPTDGRNYDQDLDAFARITNYQSKNDFGYAVIDTTSAYKNYVNFAQRGTYFDRNTSAFVIQDEINFKHGSHDLYWFMHTKAKISITGGGKIAILTLNGKTIYAKIISDGSEVFENVAASPMESSPNPDLFPGNVSSGKEQATNFGYRKLQIHNSSAEGNYKLSVIIAPYDGLISSMPDIENW